MNLNDGFEYACTYACLHLSSLNCKYLLVWCMLVAGLNDEMKTSMHRMIVRCDLLLFSHASLYLVLCICKWYLINNGAKDGIFGAL